jgi:hypothetical protein
MTNSACYASNHEEAKTNAVANNTSSNSKTLMTTHKPKLSSQLSTAKVTYPSLRITDPRFVYTNSSQTDISRRFKDVTREIPGGRLQRDDSGLEAETRITALDVLEQTLDRLSGRNSQHE